MYKENKFHTTFKEEVRDEFAGILDLCNFDVYGQQHLYFLRSGQNAIFAFFPHTGHLDSVAVRKAVPKDLRNTLVYPAAADYWYKKGPSGYIKSTFSSLVVANFPLNREGSDITKGFKQATDVLKENYSLVVSPEGGRSNDPILYRNLHTGVAKLALDSEKPIIPVRIHGMEDIMPKGTIIPRFRNEDGSKKDVRVIFGKPLLFNRKSLPRQESLARKEVTRILKEKLLEL